MQFIQHRVNTIAQLQGTPENYGVELDIRDRYNELIIQHDAFKDGESFTNYLQHYQHAFMIANIKAEGIEEQVMQDLNNKGIDNYFLLDVSLPFLVKLSKKGVRKMAVRFSAYEPIEFTMGFAGKVDWIWIDCFDGLPLNKETYVQFKKHFKMCVVSPELHGQPVENIADFKTALQTFEVDAVCTKRPELWVM